MNGLRWRRGYAVEVLGLFLTAVGLMVCASVKPEDLGKQTAAAGLGAAAMAGVQWTLRRESRAQAARWAAGAVGIGLLVVSLFWGTEQYGAKSWLLLGPVSVQPSEIAKVCFAYVAMGRTAGQRHTDAAIAVAYGAAVCVLVALGRDLGTATVFAGAVLMLAADIACRVLVSPMVLPIGALTSFLGAPLFLYLIMKRGGIP